MVLGVRELVPARGRHPGPRDARALSWLNWGKPLPEPQFGTIVVTKTKSSRHVAFVDSVNGQFTMLGGNRKRASGGGISDRASYRLLRSRITPGYRWPA